jgi:hypothetical protein
MALAWLYTAEDLVDYSVVASTMFAALQWLASVRQTLRHAAELAALDLRVEQMMGRLSRLLPTVPGVH